eukprot:7387338-Prymnesium_polylepis.1
MLHRGHGGANCTHFTCVISGGARNAGSHKISKPVESQNSGPSWTQTLILGLLEMVDCIPFTWYSHLGA